MGNKNSGRRPQPTALKVLRGNPGLRKLNEAEPIPVAGEVVKPAGLTRGGSAVWDEMAPICQAMGTLTPADVPAFRGYCELQAMFYLAAALKDSDDPTAGLARELASADKLRPYYAMFGMEPSSRARIKVPKKVDEPTNQWAGFLK